jgi:hypothetical protein
MWSSTGFSSSGCLECDGGYYGSSQRNTDGQCDGTCADTAQKALSASSGVTNVEDLFCVDCICPYGSRCGGDGHYDCVKCEAGKYTNAIGLDVCDECPVSTFYSPDEGVSEGAASATEAGCMACSEGMDCTVSGQTLHELGLLDNYWRISNISTNIRECPVGSGCTGNSSIAGGSMCAEGYQGPLCSVCADGFAKSVTLSCTECSASDFASPFVIVCVIAAILALAALRLAKSNGKVKAFMAESMRFDYAINDFKTKMKIMSVFTQCMSQLPSIINVSFPESITTLFSALDFDFMGAISLGCLVETSTFHHRLLVTTLLPLVVMALCVPICQSVSTTLKSVKRNVAQCWLWYVLTYCYIISYTAFVRPPI